MIEDKEAIKQDWPDDEHVIEEKKHDNHDTDIKAEDDFLPLFENDEAEQFRILWLEVQSSFVDNPIESVRDADELISDVIEIIRDTFANQKAVLENQWKSGDEVSTEELRIMLKRYHSLFERLLALEP